MAHCYCLENGGNFRMVSGERGSITFHILDCNDKPMPIGGYLAQFSMVDAVNKNMTQLSKKPSDITVIDDLVVVSLEPQDTSKLLAGKYLYQLEIWNDDTGPEIVAEGAVFIRQNFKEVGPFES